MEGHAAVKVLTSSPRVEVEDQDACPGTRDPVGSMAWRSRSLGFAVSRSFNRLDGLGLRLRSAVGVQECTKRQ